MKNRTYTKEMLIDAVNKYTSIRQVLIALKLNSKGGGSYRAIKNSIKEFSIDTSHFTGQGSNKGKIFSPKRDINEYLSNEKPIQSYKLKLRLLK